MLANYSGHTGIAGGQELDLKFENKRKKFNQIIDMQKKKKENYLIFAFNLLQLWLTKIKKEKIFFGKLGEEIGLLFQLADDFLDVKGSKKLAGKPIKKDWKKGKCTLINLIGYKKSIKYADNLEKKILLKLKKHGKKLII